MMMKVSGLCSQVEMIIKGLETDNQKMNGDMWESKVDDENKTLWRSDTELNTLPRSLRLGMPRKMEEESDKKLG